MIGKDWEVELEGYWEGLRGQSTSVVDDWRDQNDFQMMDHMVTDAFRSVIDAPANRIIDTKNLEEEIPNPSC